jgi:integrase
MFDEFNGWGRSVPNINRDWKAAMRREQGRLTKAATNAARSEEARSLLDDAARFEPVKCYALVHSYCTHLLNAGTDDLSLVQEARGHRDIRTAHSQRELLGCEQDQRSRFSSEGRLPSSSLGRRSSARHWRL